MKKRMIPAVILMLLLSFTLTAFAAEADSGILTGDGHYIAEPERLEAFTFPEDWSREALEFAVGNGILNGRENGLEPTAYTNRAETAVMLVRLLGAEGLGVSLSEYSDVGKGAWYYQELSCAVGIGLVKGTSETTMSPGDLITREQACTLLSRAFGIYPNNVDYCDRFADGREISGYARAAVSAMAEKKYLTGYPDGTVRPQAYITRAEMSKLIYELITHVCDEPGELPESGRVLYRGSGEIPKGYQLRGDLIVGCGYKGKRSLNGLQVSGRLVIRSAPKAQIKLLDCEAARLCVPAVVTLEGNAVFDRLDTSGQGSSIGVSANDVYVYGSCDLTQAYDSVFCEEYGVEVSVEDDLELLEVSAGSVQVTVSGAVGRCELSGADVTLTGSGSIETCRIYGANARVDWDGTVVKCYANGNNTVLTVSEKVDTFQTSQDGIKTILNGSVRLCRVNGANSTITVNGDVDDGRLSADQAKMTVNGAAKIISVVGNDTLLTAKDGVKDYRVCSDGVHAKVSGGIEKCTVAKNETVVTTSGKINQYQLTGADAKATVNANVGRCSVSGKNSVATVNGKVDDCRLSAEKAQAVVKGAVSKCIVTGKNTTITASKTITEYQLTASGVKASVNAVMEKCVVSGKESSVTVKGSMQECQITGRKSQVKVSGGIKKCVITGSQASVSSDLKISECQVTAKGIQAQIGGNVDKCVISGDNTTVTVNGSVGACRIDGDNVTLNGKGSAKTVNIYGVDYKVTLKYSTLTDHVALEEYNNALSTVKTVTDWYSHTRSDPYSEATMEGFVDKMGYSSSTKWLVWVSTKTLTVNVFNGSKGDWSLVRTMPCAMGKPSTPTIKGTFKVYLKDNEWLMGHYNCRWVTYFKGGYAFHSRLWAPDYSYLIDDSMSKLVSAGCVRMYDEDCKYIYDNVPINSTVVVY